MINRNSDELLANWYKNQNYRKPLLIRGARQVGKTTLVRAVAKKLRIELIEINMEKPWKFTSIIDLLNPKKIIEAIEFELNLTINPQKSIIFFDEVQCKPELLKLLRYFYEETPQYAIVATGSLLEFVLAEPEFSLPVGRIELLHLGPLSFEEFLRATNELKAIEFINNYLLGDEISEVIHSKLTELLHIYIVIGGMPEIVNAYKEKSGMLQIERMKSNIIETYKLDFNKYTKHINIQLLTLILNSMPILIGKKVKYTNIDKQHRSNDISKSFNQLCLAKIIIKIFNSDCNGIPLGAEKKLNFFKPSFLDIGLLTTITKIEPLEITQNKQLNYINNGTLAEQFISQQLLDLQDNFREPELYYWSREKKGSSSEVDFVITDSKQNIIPIEVKSGKTGSLRSLQMMIFEKSIKRAVRFNSDFPTVLKERKNTIKGEIEYTLISMPHYLVGQIYRLLNN